MSLSPNQRKVVSCSTHCLVIACAGSGKTTVLAHKAEHILFAQPDAKIVIATFTKDSATDIRSRIISVAGKTSARQVASGTFHRLALDQLKRAGYKFKIIQDPQVRQFIKRALEETNQLNMDIDSAISIIEKCRLNLNYEDSHDDIGRLYTSYTNLLKQNNSLDFAGIILLAVKLMRSGKLPPKPCQFIFCDEAQDMDELQLAWCAEHIKVGAICTVVGDDDQSIYRFRNSLGYEGMMRFYEEFGAVQIILDANYRSREEILNAAGKVISNNSIRMIKNLESQRGPGGKVELWHCYNAINEANLIVRKLIEDCSSNYNPFPDKFKVGVRDGQWAILARNNHNLNILAMKLVAEGIPHSYKEKSLWAEQPVCFALGLLSSLVSGDRAGCEAALYFSGVKQDVLKRCFEIYGEDFAEFTYCAHEKDLTEFDKVVVDELIKFSHVVQSWERELLKERVNLVIISVFDWFINQLNLRELREGKNKHKSDIKSLADACKIFSGIDGPLKKRLQRVMINISGDKKNENKIPGVFLGTIHSSKGLEFENIWSLQMDHEVIPNLKELSVEAIEEERRLFFVMMTRAKNALYISCTQYPSGFLAETGVQLQSVYELDGFDPNTSS